MGCYDRTIFGIQLFENLESESAKKIFTIEIKHYIEALQDLQEKKGCIEL